MPLGLAGLTESIPSQTANLPRDTTTYPRGTYTPSPTQTHSGPETPAAAGWSNAWSNCYCSRMWSQSKKENSHCEIRKHRLHEKKTCPSFSVALEVEQAERHSLKRQLPHAAFKWVVTVVEQTVHESRAEIYGRWCAHSVRNGLQLHLLCALNGFCFAAIRKAFRRSCLPVHHTPYKGVSKVKCLGATNRRADP